MLGVNSALTDVSHGSDIVRWLSVAGKQMGEGPGGTDLTEETQETGNVGVWEREWSADMPITRDQLGGRAGLRCARTLPIYLHILLLP